MVDMGCMEQLQPTREFSDRDLAANFFQELWFWSFEMLWEKQQWCWQSQKHGMVGCVAMELFVALLA